MLSHGLSQIKEKGLKLTKLAKPRIKKEKAVGVVLTAWQCFGGSESIAHAENASSAPEHKKVLLVSHGGYMSCASSSRRNSDSSFGPTGLRVEDISGTHSTARREMLGSNPPVVVGSFTHQISVGHCKPKVENGKEENPCANRKRPWLKKSVREALEEEGYEVDWIVSCYAMDPEVVYMLGSDQPTGQLSTTRENMWNKIKSMASTVGRILVVGHSYGGWTAMKTVMELDRNVDQLMTLDPISVEHCTPTNYLRGSEDCMRFPRDIDVAKQELVDQKASVWKHYWQEITKPVGWQLGLHSGALALGHDRVLQKKLDFGHSEMHDQGEIWQDFVSSFDENIELFENVEN